MGWPQLLRHAEQHLWVLAPSCARAHGVDPRRLAARAARERWPTVVAGTVALPGSLVNAKIRTIGHALSSDRRVVVTGHSALALHGLVSPAPSTTDLLVERNQPAVRDSRVQTRWTRALPDHSVRSLYGIDVAHVARALADVAAATTPERLRALTFDAVHRRMLTPGDLERELAARRRFPGRTRYRDLLRDLVGDGSESGFEFEVRQRLIAHGLAPDKEQPVFPTPTGHYRVDIGYADVRVGVECLGFAYHSQPDALDADTERSNSIALLTGWSILRLTYRMFHQSFEPFARQLRSLLAARGRPL